MICIQISDAIDPKYNFIVYRDAKDNIMNSKIWAFTETAQEAWDLIVSETKAYDSTEYTFNYGKIERSSNT